MKKIIAMMLYLVLAFSMAGCGTKTTGNGVPHAGGEDKTNNNNNVDTEKTQVAMTSDCKAFNTEGVKIEIDNIIYVCTDMQMSIEPDESVIEYVEIPVEGSSAITAFARISDNGEDYLICLIGEEWYKFIAE